MNIHTTALEFERATRFLVEYLPESQKDSRKPILFHNLRVWQYLYARWYDQNIVIGWVLHDVLEWSKAHEALLAKEFWDTILNLVKASTKDDSIEDKVSKTHELIQRCIATGEDALIIKTADILDSFARYTQRENEKELEYCMRNANEILTQKPSEFQDPIFEELGKWMRRSEKKPKKHS